MSTILTDVVQIKEAEQMLTSYIDRNRPDDGSYNLDVDNASMMRANVRDQKKIMDKKKLFEINTMTEADIRLAGLTKTEQCVLLKRLEMRTSSFREVDVALGYSSEGKTSWAIYQKAIKKIEKFLILSETDRIKRLLSPQQLEVYKLMNDGLSSTEIAKILSCSDATVRMSKKRIRTKLKSFEELSK